MTLTQVAILTKRTIFISILLLLIGTSTFVGFQIWQAQYIKSIPKPEEKPDIKFGLLPKPDFLRPEVTSANFSYSLDTSTGSLPTFPQTIKVYFIPKATITFSSNDKASALAQKLGIKSSPQIVSESIHQFQDSNKILTYHLDSGRFIFKKESTTTAFTLLEDEGQLITQFRRLLSDLGIFNDSLKNSPTRLKLLQETSAAAILLWPKEIDKIPIVTSNFTDSLIEATSSGNFQTPENILALKYTFWPVDETSFATYPLKTASQALDDLKNAKGIIVIVPELPQVSITSVYLAYLESENYNPYLLPVVVFEGPSFVGYVNAIPDQYVNQSR